MSVEDIAIRASPPDISNKSVNHLTEVRNFDLNKSESLRKKYIQQQLMKLLCVKQVVV
ncbi:hypothetical protein DPMN_145028 [Dreissena polymorpha]|uniref:Uncharacterized protein n=1 Tax=Dreissena polymorpha TaxID=45954 RepID=A0A9D4IYF1_DREPO|nr:hypothetical protein DPMN_145028 [Dreissena polymorpha]